MRTDDEGFTLIELLAVVLIIGVLAAIALPRFLSQRDKAYHATMKSDLRNLVTSELAYMVNNPGYTTDQVALANEGFHLSPSDIAHIVVGATNFVACTKHGAVTDWLVYDSATSTTVLTTTDCAGAVVS